AEKSLRESEGKYRLLAENTLDCIWKMDKDLKFTYINQSILPLLGYTREEWTGSKLAEHCSKKEMQHFIDIVEGELRKKDTYSAMFEMNLIHKDGREIPLEILGKILLDESNKVTGFQGNARDITERIQADRIQKTLYDISNALNTVGNLHELFIKIREYLGNVIDTKNFYIALYDEKNDVISLPFEVDEKDKYESFPAGKTLTKYVIQLEKHLFAPLKLQDELTEQGKIEVIGTPSEIWLGVPLKVENSVIGVIAVQSYDDPNLYTEKDLEILTFISEEIALAIKHKQAEEQIKKDLEEKKIMLQEIHHRVKNNLQIISSLLNMQSSYIKDDEDKMLFQESRNRVLTMALIHEQLYRTEDLSSIDFNNYVKSATRHLMASYSVDPNQIRVRFDITEISFDINIAIPCGLIINELVSNAMKYAFPENKKGEIFISIKHIDDSYRLFVSDNGVGMSKKTKLNNPATLGLQLVDALTKQIHGAVEIDRKQGTKFTITFKKPEIKTFQSV
ncbi:MAG: PAS domain S-box protein, partial [Candidatus Cloacimonetes bacterium]|nr:PAS domain S-box protein [Candidatus Cloacimonadota bacterium]